MNYVATPVKSKPAKPLIRSRLMREHDNKQLSRYTSLQLLGHLYSRHEADMLRIAVPLLLAVIFWLKLG